MDFESVIKKVSKKSNSKFLLVPKMICDRLYLKEGTEVKVSLVKASQVKTFRCPFCQSSFHDERKDVYDCPICNQEILHHQIKEMI